LISNLKLKLKNWASGNFSSFSLFIVVFPFITILFTILSPHFVSDSRMHLLIARNLLNGLGHTYLEANIQDISQIKAVSINFWPPGYSLLLIPFLALGLNSLLIITLTDCLAILLVYFIWYEILKNVFKKNFPTLVLIVFTSFTFGFTPLGMYYSLGTNIWAVIWFSLAIFQIIKIYDNRLSLNWVSICSLYLFVFLCSFFRYSYYPISLVLSLSLLVVFYKTIFFKKAVLSLIIPLVIFASFLSYQKFQSNNLNYVDTFHEKDNQTIYLKNLEKTSAIISNSFLYPINYKSTNLISSTFLFLQDYKTLNKKQIFNTSLKIAFILCLSVLLVLALINVYKKLSLIPKRFFILFLTLIVSQILFFVMLSVKYPPEIFRGVNSVSSWTYVEEVRYYNAINLIIMVSGIWALISFRKRLAYILLFLIACFNFVKFIKQKSELSLNINSNIEKKSFWILKSIPSSMVLPKSVFYEKKLVQRKSNYHFVSVMYAEKGIPTLKYLPPEDLKTNEAINLIFAIDRIESDGGDSVFKKLIHKNEARKLGTMFNRKVDIWSIEFKPGQHLNL